jgi:hypothetical protein
MFTFVNLSAGLNIPQNIMFTVYSNKFSIV